MPQKPPPHVHRKPAWIRRAAEQINRTAFNKAFIIEEIGDVIANHAKRPKRGRASEFWRAYHSLDGIE